MGRQGVVIDPAVAAIIQDGTRREGQRGMTRTQRRQAKRDAERQRVTYEVDPAVAAIVAGIAEREGCSPAGVVNLMVATAARGYVRGELEFCGHRRESRSPRYEWVVELNGEAKRLLNELRAK